MGSQPFGTPKTEKETKKRKGDGRDVFRRGRIFTSFGAMPDTELQPVCKGPSQ